MAGSFEVRLDEERQIIVVALRGGLSLEQFEAMAQQTHACGDRLRDPASVRVLTDARAMHNASWHVRKRAAEEAKHPSLHRMAFWGPGLPMRAALLFLSVMVGGDVVRVFRTEAEALDWLLEREGERRDGQ